MHYERRKRFRKLISRLNKERKKQRMQIDLLCNDLIAAQRDFIQQLGIISFSACFYESIVGINDLNILLSKSAEVISEKLLDTNIVFVLSERDNFEVFASGSEEAGECQLEKYFTVELVRNICEANKLCTLDDMIPLGLQAGPGVLSQLFASAIPLSQVAGRKGFILLYRNCGEDFSSGELDYISLITVGLAKAVSGCPAKTKQGYML